MQIRIDQWRELARRSFDARLLALIRQYHPEEAGAVAQDGFAEFADAMRMQAGTYGLRDEQSAAAFVYAAWLFGDGFDVRIPVIAQVLGDPSLPAADKAQALTDFSVLAFDVLGGSAGLAR